MTAGNPMLGPVPPINFEGNGMGTRKTGWLVHVLLWFAHDILAELDRGPARYHDWAYFLGGSAEDKLRADLDLAYNVWYVAEALWPPWKRWWLHKRLVLQVFAGVWLAGDKAFNFHK